MSVLGWITFVIALLISVMIHEWGHYITAKKFGMKVTEFFVGFGSRIWSFRRGETEYGLKALPLGGFCDIAGMTALDEVEPHEVDRAMYRQSTRKRLVVMCGGIAMNFLLGFVLIVILAVGWGLPHLDGPPETQIWPQCVAGEQSDGSTIPCSGPGPAERAGLQRGDRVVAINGAPVDTWNALQSKTQDQTRPVVYTVRRDDRTVDIPVQPEPVTVYPKDKKTGKVVGGPTVVSKVGVTQDYYPPDKYNVLTALPASVGFTGQMFGKTFEALAQMPAKVSGLWHAVTGGERSADTPVSVYGASRIGGETAERGLWNMFILVLASLNFFLGAFNILPLLPLDGGHIAVVLYEKVRNVIRGRRGLSPGGPVDYLKLLPATYVVVVIGGAYMILTLVADIVNPIRLW